MPKDIVKEEDRSKQWNNTFSKVTSYQATNSIDKRWEQRQI